MEYELKIQGDKKNLSEIMRRFIAGPDSLRDRNYSFNTYYLDYDNRFYDGGYSLRHRTGELTCGYAPATEIKALEGERSGISARLEIEAKGEDALVNYFNLMAHPEYPKSAPKIAPNLLNISMATAVRRMERRALVELDTGVFMVEACA